MMTPGTYLRLRREAADVSIEMLASMLSVSPLRRRPRLRGDLAALADRLHAAEADYPPLPIWHADLLRPTISFDRHVYEQLLLRHEGAAVPVPQICRGCGCSWFDPCIAQDGSSCRWTNHDPELCTRCDLGPAAADRRGAPEAEGLAR